MGFQSSFNQLLATASAGALGYKHIKGQKEANEMAAWKEASNMSEEGHELEAQALETKQLTDKTNKEIADVLDKDILTYESASTASLISCKLYSGLWNHSRR